MQTQQAELMQSKWFIGWGQICETEAGMGQNQGPVQNTQNTEGEVKNTETGSRSRCAHRQPEMEEQWGGKEHK